MVSVDKGKMKASDRLGNKKIIKSGDCRVEFLHHIPLQNNVLKSTVYTAAINEKDLQICLACLPRVECFC